MPTVRTMEEAVALIRPGRSDRLRARPGHPGRPADGVGGTHRLGGPADRGGTVPQSLRGLHQARGELPLWLLRPGGAAATTPGSPRGARAGGLPPDGADHGPLRPRVMVVQAAPPDAQRRGQPLPPRRRDARRAAPGRAGPRPVAHRRGQPAPSPHQEPAAHVRQHHSAGRHRRARRVRRRAVRARRTRPRPRWTRPSRATRWTTCVTGPHCRRVSAPSPTSWRRSWRVGRSAASASIRRCSPRASCGCTRPAR